MKCPTCGKLFGTIIFQCSTGHSACESCKKNNKLCGQCMQPLTDIQNYALQEYIAGLTLEESQPNRRNRTGRIPAAEDERSATNAALECPMGAHDVDHRCEWKGSLAQISDHFATAHPDTLKATVEQELVLSPKLLEQLNIDSCKNINFIDLGAQKFLTFLTLDQSGPGGTVSMAVQMLANAKQASQWFFELHMYNKAEPNRKITFKDTCKHINAPLKCLDEEATCVIPLSLARTFYNARIDGMNYKFFIKRLPRPSKLPPQQQPLRRGQGRRPNTNHGSGRNNLFSDDDDDFYTVDNCLIDLVF